MKKIVVGIDVSKEKIDASVLVRPKMGEAHEVTYAGHFENSPRGFKAMVREVRRLSGSRSPREWLFCCETTGAYDYALCEWLSGRGLCIWREHAMAIKNGCGVVRGKSDRADSKAIAEYAMRFSDRVRPYQPESPEMKELKALFSHRKALVEDLVSWKNRHTVLRRTLPEGSPSLRVADDCKEMVSLIKKKIARCEKRMAEVIAQSAELSRSFGHLMSITGVGPVNAVGMIVSTGNFTRFNTYREFLCYSGIAPFRRESGTSVSGRANVSHLSNRLMKSYLSLAARSASRTPGPLRDYFLRMISKGKKYGVAINNLKAKIAKIMFTLVEKDTDFDPNYEKTHSFSTSKTQFIHNMLHQHPEQIPLI